MIWCLGAIFYLTETFVDVVSRLVDGFREELVVHKVGARTGAQIAAVFDQFHAAQIDFTISLDCDFDGVSRICEGRRIKDNNIEFFTFFFKTRQQFKDILAHERCYVFQAV